MYAVNWDQLTASTWLSVNSFYLRSADRNCIALFEAFEKIPNYMTGGRFAESKLASAIENMFVLCVCL
jgi:hypothetical protein